MGNRILWAVIIGVLGVVLIPYMKSPIELMLSFSEPYPPFVQLLVDNIFLMLFVGWIAVILLLLFWKRGSPSDTGGE